MNGLSRLLAGLLEHSAWLLPKDRRGWSDAALAEAARIPADLERVAWLCGALWLVVREAGMGLVLRALAFAAGAVALAWIAWPGASSNSATPLNRMYVTGTVVLLAGLPWVVRRYAGPLRGGFGPAAARVSGYLLAGVLVAAKAVLDRDGSVLGRYFVIVPGQWALEVVLLLVIAGYVAGLFILTSERFRLARWGLPAALGLGVVTAAAGPLASAGLNVTRGGSPAGWWWLAAALALPLAAGWLAARLAAREARPGALSPVRQACLAASCATAATALLVAVLTSVMVALFPHLVPLQGSPAAGGGGNAYISHGGCETCDPDQTVIPPGLRRAYRAEITVGQAATSAYASLLVAPLAGAGLGALGGALTLAAPRRRWSRPRGEAVP
jgi:hypothetical protein